ncbi:MAG: hypothetical protein NTV12_10415, partial [Verrucomicrobia bacterium]|nr:hypothetical protein [Verrucomicrobiota bacterium]
LRHLPHPTRGVIPSFPGTLSARRLLRGNVGPLQAAAGQDWLRSNLYLLQLKPGLEPRAIADQLTRRADVLYAEPNFIVRVSTLPPQLATKDSQ